MRPTHSPRRSIIRSARCGCGRPAADHCCSRYQKRTFSVVYQDFITAATFRSITMKSVRPMPVFEEACIRQLAEENVSGVLIPGSSAQRRSRRRSGKLRRRRSRCDRQLGAAAGRDPVLCRTEHAQSGSVAVRMMDLFLKEPPGSVLISLSQHALLPNSVSASSRALRRVPVPPAAKSCRSYIEETLEDAYQQTMDLLRDAPTLNALFITCGCVTDICRADGGLLQGSSRLAQPVIICYEKYM